MKIPLSFGNYAGRNSTDAQELVNMMAELDQQGGKEQVYLVGTPGLKEWKIVESGKETRGGYILDTVVLAVVGTTLYSINRSSKVQTNKGTVAGSGPVQFTENPTQIMITTSALGYIYTKTSGALTQITDTDFPVPKSATFQDGYGIVVQTGTGKFYISGLNNFATWDPLEFTTAEALPDNLVAALSDHQDMIAFGSESIENYINSGNVDFPFTRRAGAILEIGCSAPLSPAKGENVVFWVDNHGLVRKMEGFTPVIISTRQIEYQISLQDYSQAVGNCYTQEGHTFYVLMMPTLTLVYDVATQQWHKRASYPDNGKWRGTWIAQRDDFVLAGDYENGTIYELDLDTYTDNSQPIHWVATTQEIHHDRKRVAHRALELHVESGVGLISGQGEEALMWMSYSDDQGRTYGNERIRSMGKIGEYIKRIIWRTLGIPRSRIYKFEGTDPVKRVLISAHVDGEAFGV
jgi:hypothetical protein